MKIICKCLILLALFASLGCTSSLFTGDTKNDQPVGNGQVNTACFGMNLANETLDVPSAKALIHCLNANGSIQEFQALVDSTTDDQMQSMVDVINNEVMLNKRLLKDLHISYQQADQAGVLDSLFQKFGKLMSNTDLTLSALKLLRQGVQTDQPVSNGKNIDSSVFKVLQVVAKEFGQGAEARANANRALEFGIRSSSLKAYTEAVKGLRPPIAPGNPTLRAMTGRILDYLQSKISADHALSKVMLWGIADQSLLKGMDSFYGNSCENSGSSKCNDHADTVRLTTDDQVQAMEHFMRFLNPLRPEGHDRAKDPIGRMAQLFGLHDDSFVCLDGTKEVSNGDMYVMDEFIKKDPIEVPFWTIRSNLLKLKVANRMCNFPSGMNGFLDILRDMADFREPNDADGDKSRRLLVTVTHFLKALKTADGMPMDPEALADISPYFTATKQGQTYRYDAGERYRRFMIHWMGDTSEKNIYNSMADGIAELASAERRTLANVLYLLNSAGPGSEDRDSLSKAARVLMRVRPELRSTEASAPGTNPTQARSIYDVLTRIFLRSKASTIYDVFVGMKGFIDSDEDYMNPVLSSFRQGLWINDANPGLDLLLSVGRKADKYETFFNTMFDLSTKPELEGALRLASKMAQNGSLKELVRGVILVLKRSADGMPGEPQLASAPVMTPVEKARDISTANEKTWSPMPVFWPVSPFDPEEKGIAACKSMDLGFGITDVTRAGWTNEINKMAACVDASGMYPSVPQLAAYATDPSKTVKDGKTLAAFGVDMASKLFDLADQPGATLASRKKAYDEFSDLLVQPDTRADMIEAQKMLPFLLDRTFCTSYNRFGRPGECPAQTERVAVLQGLSRSLKLVADEGPRLQQLAEVGRSVVLSPRAPKTVALVYDSADRADSLGEAMPNLPDPTIRPDVPVNGASAQEVSEYWNNVRNQDRAQGYANSEEFKRALRPLLDRLADSNQRVLDAFLTIAFKFDGNPYDPEWLEGWFHRNSANVRFIQYIYPGTKKPVRRLVNMLDMMELIVMEADFTLNEAKQPLAFLVNKNPDENFVIRYLSRLAQSGPAAKYDMQEWIDGMTQELTSYWSMASDSSFLFKSTVADEVYRRLHNLLGVLPVLQEMKNHNEFGPGGVVRNDLGFVRDLMRAILSATPKKNWNYYDRNVNSLGLMCELVKLGSLRVFSTNFWEKDAKSNLARPVRVSHILRLALKTMQVRQGNDYQTNVKLLQTLDHLLRKDTRGDAKAFGDRYVTIGRILDVVFDWMKNDAQLAASGRTPVKSILKRGAYNSTYLLEEVELAGRKAGIDLPRILPTLLRPLLGTPEGTALVSGQVDLLESLLTQTKGIFFVNGVLSAKYVEMPDMNGHYIPARAFQDTVSLLAEVIAKMAAGNGALADDSIAVLSKLFSDPRGASLRGTIDALRNLSDDSDYKELKRQSLSRILGQVVHWLPQGAEGKVLPDWTRNYLGARLAASNGGVSDLVAMGLFIGRESPLDPERRKSDTFYNQVRFLGQADYVKALQDFIDFLSSGIQDVYQVPQIPLRVTAHR